MPKIRILLIEDNRILREGMVALLERRGYDVSAVSDGRDSTLTRLSALKPRLVLMDLGLQRQNSLDVVRAARKILPGVKILGMGLIPAQSDIMEFVQAGADGFVLKSATVEELAATIAAVAGGATVLPPILTGSLFSQVADYAISRGKRNLRSAIRMTVREKQVIAAIVDGMSNKQIAESLDIAIFTVKSHVHNIMEKMALHSRLQIAIHARDEGAPAKD